MYSFVLVVRERVLANKSSSSYLVCSRPQATARASPSTGAYLCSADDKERDPARITRHPESQQFNILTVFPQEEVSVFSVGPIWA